jgi:hypothetical protein
VVRVVREAREATVQMEDSVVVEWLSSLPTVVQTVAQAATGERAVGAVPGAHPVAAAWNMPEDKRVSSARPSLITRLSSARAARGPQAARPVLVGSRALACLVFLTVFLSLSP